MERFIDRLQSGKPLLGTMIMYTRNPGVVRMAAAAGLDYVTIDAQHSSFGLETMGDMCEVARAIGIAPIIRPSLVTQETVDQYLDLGAAGLMLHGVRSATQVVAALNMVRYPPDGERGVSIGGPSADYRAGGVDAEFLASQNDSLVLIAQIEGADGLADVDQIAATGIDVLNVGRQDLAISLGVPGQVGHPDVSAAVERVFAIGREHGKRLSLAAGSIEEAKALAAAGVAMITWKNDKTILQGSFRSFADALHD